MNAKSFVHRLPAIALPVALSLAACSGGAEIDPASTAGAAVTSAPSYTFSELPLTATDVGASGYGDMCITGPASGLLNGVVACRTSAYSPLASFSTQYASAGVEARGDEIDVGRVPWYLDHGAIHKQDPTTHDYPAIGGSATDIGVSPTGDTVYVVGVDLHGVGDHPIYRWTGATTGNPWVLMANQYGVRIDAADDGSAWVVNYAGEVWQIGGDPSNPWTKRIGPSWTVATDISVSEAGVFIVGGPSTPPPFAKTEYPLYWYDASANDFARLGSAAGVHLTSALGGLTVTDGSGHVWTSEVQY